MEDDLTPRNGNLPRRSERTRSSSGWLFAALALAACGDGPTRPPSPPPPQPVDRAALLAEVRTLAEQRDLGPIAGPASVRTALVELGRVLAFDKILSGNRDISCMTCHPPAFGTGDTRSLAIGQGASGLGPTRVHPDGAFIPRNSPGLFNLHLQDAFFWDGRVETMDNGDLRTPAGTLLTPAMEAVFEFGALSAFPLFPVLSRSEMRGVQGNELALIADGDLTGIWAALMVRLGAIAEYRQMFEVAYPGTPFDDMTLAHASNAIAGFIVEEFAFVDTPWDRFLLGDDSQLTDEQLFGAQSFMNRRCMRCHEADNFSDGEFHNVATPQLGPGAGDGPVGTDDFGRERVTSDPAERRAFRTPQLRNVELTAPYAHAGQFAELLTIVEHYDDIDMRLMEYDITQVEAALQGTMLDNFAEILTTRDTSLLTVTFDEGEAENIRDFLLALTDDAARNLMGVIPATVPSGLEVDR